MPLMMEDDIHMVLGEMTVTLDDVTCLMHLSMEGRMLSHPKKMSRADGVDLMVRHLGVTQAVAMKNCVKSMVVTLVIRHCGSIIRATLIPLPDWRI